MQFLQGNEACVKGAIAAGCRFYAGYPITPSSEIMEKMAVELPKVGGVFIQMEDEMAGMAAVIGAVWAGAKAMTATSGPGFSLMMENIGYALMTETPCVIVNVQRAGPATGQATKPASADLMQARWGSHGDYEIIVLSPWSVLEMYDLTIRAFNLAEIYRLPVILLSDEAVGHLREKVDLSKDITVVKRAPKSDLPPFGYPANDLAHKDQPTPMPTFGQGRKLLVTGSTHDEWGYRQTQNPLVQARLTNRLCNKIRNNIDMISEIEPYEVTPDTEILIIAYGFTARSALRAVRLAREKGIKVGLVRLKTLWPVSLKLFQGLNRKISRIIVPEMNQGQMVREVQRLAPKDIEVIPFNKTDGTVITPQEILKCLESSR